MTGTEWKKCLPNFPVSSEEPADWNFQQIAPLMAAQNPDCKQESPLKFKKGLKVAGKLELKPFALYRSLKFAAIAMLVAILVAFSWLLATNWSTIIGNIGKEFAWLIGVGVCLIGIKEVILQRILKYRNGYLQILGSFIMCTVGWMLAYPYLWLIDPLYVTWGSAYRSKSVRSV
jgi:hypothetical protein